MNIIFSDRMNAIEIYPIAFMAYGIYKRKNQALTWNDELIPVEIPSSTTESSSEPDFDYTTEEERSSSPDSINGSGDSGKLLSYIYIMTCLIIFRKSISTTCNGKRRHQTCD